MESAASHEITALLRAWSQGDQGALESLIPIVDRELRRVAKRHDPILETTALGRSGYRTGIL